jgi:hypothetical protein
MRIMPMLAVGAGVTALLIGGAGAAQAGEVNGNGDPVPAVERANSICAFSGQNDEPDAEFPEGGRVQSYGQLVRLGLKDVVPGPGVACNGHTGFLTGGGE